MNPPVARLVDPLALLAGARHPDPFSVLGPHVTGTAVVIRAILPGAERVDVIAQGMAVPVAMKDSTVIPGNPVALFVTGLPAQTFKASYAAARDGRFLVNSVSDVGSTSPITLVVNWTDPTH